MEWRDSREGCLGPASNVSAARQLIRDGVEIDVAVLDLNLSNGSVTPVLEALPGRDIPMIVYTGGSLPDALGHRHPNRRVLTKPVSPARLLGELRLVLRGSSPQKPVVAP